MPKKRTRKVHHHATRKPTLTGAPPPTFTGPPFTGPTLERPALDQLSLGRLETQPGGTVSDENDSIDLLAAEGAQIIDSLGRELLRAIASSRSPLDPELAVSLTFGVTVLGAISSPLEESSPLEQLADSLTGWAAQEATTEALILLRVVETLGPPRNRDAARATAADLLDRGVATRGWADRIGRPTFLRAWRNSDVFGHQESIGLLFAYGSRSHAVMTLIDHDLGGGVKDVWVAQGKPANGLRDRVAAEMAGEPLAVFEDLDAVRAAILLASALKHETCATADDQIDDVGAHLILLRSRTEHLIAMSGASISLGETPVGRPLHESSLIRLKVSLHGAKPPIWRRLELPSAMSLADLHHVLQTAFGWNDTHQHEFERPQGGRAGWGAPIDGSAEGQTRLGSVAVDVGDRLTYRYDFGDDWQHDLVVEAVEAVDVADAGSSIRPRCTGGRRAAPPEDCGGVHGYEAMLEIASDPDHEEHRDVVEWLSQGFDPARFDRERIDAVLATFPFPAKSTVLTRTYSNPGFLDRG